MTAKFHSQITLSWYLNILFLIHFRVLSIEQMYPVQFEANLTILSTKNGILVFPYHCIAMQKLKRSPFNFNRGKDRYVAIY